MADNMRLLRSKKAGHNRAVEKQKKQLSPADKKKRLIVWGLLLAISCLSLFLNTTAMDWGQTGEVSWSPDSIEGSVTVTYMPYFFKMWPHKYPRGQYLINSVFYKPKIEQWQKDPVAVRTPDGKTAYSPFNQQRLYELAAITRKITIAMSIGILLAVFLTARKLLKDDAAALLSVLCLALAGDFVYYSKTGCVDIPAFFWFAWAACFGLYAVKNDNLFMYLLAGFCAAWSVCTKEGVATFHIGLAAALAVLLVHKGLSEGKPLKNALISVLRWKVLAGAAIAILVFVTLEGMWAGLGEWRHRSKFWEGVVEGEFKGAGYSLSNLFYQTYDGLFSSWGLPFLILLAISVIYWLIRYRWQLSLVLLPLLSFFCLTVLVVERNLPRFMLCAFAGIAILMGKTLADWYGAKKIPVVIRLILPLIVLVPSLLFCIFENLEMKYDTRVRTEEWMRANAKPGAIVGLSMKKHYAPRLWMDGFRSIPQWDSKGMDTPQGKIKIQPDYIIGTYEWPCMTQVDEPFFNQMFAGKTEYEKHVQFQKLYFTPSAAIWKYCLRFFKLHGGISPLMMVYENKGD